MSAWRGGRGEAPAVEEGAGADELVTLCTRINEELATLLKAVDRTDTANSAHMVDLTAVRSDLPSRESASDLRSLTTRLIEISRLQAEEAAFLKQSLTSSRNQLTTMRRQVNGIRGSSNMDELTGLAKRRHFEETLLRQIEAYRESGAKFCLALAGIDRLQLINQKFDRGVGDSIVQHFAHMIEQNVKGKDFVARFDGAVFALVLQDAEPRGAGRFLEQMRQKFGATRLVTAEKKAAIGRVTVSCGVTAIRPEDTMNSLISRASKTLRDAKNSGRDNVKIRE